MSASTSDQGQSSGPAVDRGGAPVIDPTANVRELVAAAILRQDDLRKVAAAHSREISDLRASYEEKLRDKESERIDAIRAVDAAAVQRAAEVQAQQAGALATQVTATAETLRVQVANTALAAATALTTALQPIQKSIEELRVTQYQQQGEKSSKTEDRGANQWVISLIVGAIFSIVGLGVGIAIAATR